jgi:hypothetical protein
MKTTKIIATIASRISTKNLIAIDNILMTIKMEKMRSIITGELFSRNDLLSNL